MAAIDAGVGKVVLVLMPAAHDLHVPLPHALLQQPHGFEGLAR